MWVEQRKWTRFRAGSLMTRVIPVPQDPPTHVGPLGQDLISPAPSLCAPCVPPLAQCRILDAISLDGHPSGSNRTWIVLVAIDGVEVE